MPDTLHINLSLDKICLFVDADGTLLDIASRPESAKATSDTLEILGALYLALGGALAIVSGRRIEDIDTLFAPLRLPASGIHGAQLRRAPEHPISDAGIPDIPPSVQKIVEGVAARHAGVFVEHKQKALAVHWRAAQERETALLDELGAAVDRMEPELVILRGHCVFEVKSPSSTKGEAVRDFMETEPFAGRIPIFIGDDVTDIAGFAAVKALGGHAFSVGRKLEGADAVFKSPAEVRAWLGGLIATRQEARRA